MKQADKEALVGTMAEIFKSHQVGLLVDFRGMSVAGVTELRRRLHETATTMRVLKNRIAKIAVKGTPFEALQEQMVDTRALVFGQEPVGPAKVVIKYQEENEKFKVIGGLLVNKDRTGGDLLNPARIKALSSLPPRKELLSLLMFLMKAPQTQFVRTLNEIPARMVRTLAAVRDAKANA